VFRQLVPLSRPVCRADWRKSARLFAYSPGVHCRDGLSAGANQIRNLGPTVNGMAAEQTPVAQKFPGTGAMCGAIWRPKIY